MTKVAIIDYGSGNLRSAAKAFEHEGADRVFVTDDPKVVLDADRVVLPGVGAFGDCRRGLYAVDGMVAALETAVHKQGKPFFGICVGMQLMASRGHEYELTQGLGWIGGDVEKIEPADTSLKVPHMGWNNLVIDHPHALLEGIQSGDHTYFVHSYQFHVTNPAERLAHVDYGGEVTAIIGRDTMVGMQFHPEKSQDIGLKMIGNFLTWKP